MLHFSSSVEAIDTLSLSWRLNENNCLRTWHLEPCSSIKDFVCIYQGSLLAKRRGHQSESVHKTTIGVSAKVQWNSLLLVCMSAVSLRATRSPPALLRLLQDPISSCWTITVYVHSSQHPHHWQIFRFLLFCTASAQLCSICLYISCLLCVICVYSVFMLMFYCHTSLRKTLQGRRPNVKHMCREMTVG